MRDAEWGTSPLYARSTHCGRRAFENSKIINFSKNLAKVLINLPGNSVPDSSLLLSTIYLLADNHLDMLLLLLQRQESLILVF